MSHSFSIKATALQPFTVDTSGGSWRTGSQQIGWNIAVNRRSHCGKAVRPDRAELVHQCKAAEDGVIVDNDMPGKRGAVRHNDMIFEHAVVRHMGISHQQVVITDTGLSLILYRAAMDGDIFPDGITITNLQMRLFP